MVTIKAIIVFELNIEMVGMTDQWIWHYDFIGLLEVWLLLRISTSATY